MRVYIITRFSICDPNSNGFILTRNSKTHQKYVDALFSDYRLYNKFKFFKKITVPSILKQTNQNFEWLICTSILLPKRYKFELLKISKLSPKIKIFFVKDFSSMWATLRRYPFDKEYATVRLDDDDGLNTHFIERLQRYSEEKGKIISFTHGKLVTVNNRGSILLGKDMRKKMVSQGMSGIGMNIYHCGNHVNVDKRYPVIYDSMNMAYFMGCSNYCDTGRPFRM